MTKAEYMEMISQHWDELQDLHKHDNLYNFEKDFHRIAMVDPTSYQDWATIGLNSFSHLKRF